MSEREKKVRVLHRDGEGAEERDDRIAVEEPLEIRIGGTPTTVIMRTPGRDEELALRLLRAHRDIFASISGLHGGRIDRLRKIFVFED